MALWKAFTAGLRRLISPRRAEADLDDELQAYIADATAHYIEHGLTPDEAARRVAIDIGSRAAVKDEVRQGAWEHVVETTVRDTRLALRGLAHTPGFTVVAVLTLALGLGATTAIFSVVNPILLRPLPYAGAGRLVLIGDRTSGDNVIPTTYGTFRELTARSHTFEVLATSDEWTPVLGDTSDPVRLTGQRITSDYFRVFGVTPAIGRGFTADDERPGAPDVVILSDAAVMTRFSGDRRILGRTITLDGTPFLVVGILPKGFTTAVSPDATVWAPVHYRWPVELQSAEWGHHMTMIGRVLGGVPLEAARQDLDGIARAPVADFARARWADLSRGLVVKPLQEAVTTSVRPALVAVFSAVLILLAVAAANVTNLLLARGALRRAEFAMRAALGAGRGRLIRQVLVESVALTGVGGILGLGVAFAGVRALIALGPPGWPNLDTIHVDPAAFTFAFALALFVGLAVGLVPALEASRPEATPTIAAASRRLTFGRRRLRGVLVVAEISLALVLLCGAGLLWRSVSRLLSSPTGFNASGALTFRVRLGGAALTADAARRRRFLDLLAAVRAVPGVTSAALTSQLPLSGDVDSYGVQFRSVENASPDGDGAALRYAVAGDYFSAMGIPLVRGRLLREADGPGALEAVLVNESYARRKFGTTDPIGQRVRFGPETIDPKRPWDVIVGVVGDVKQQSLAFDHPDAFYVAMGQWPWVDREQSFVVRTSGDAAALAPDIIRAIHSVDPARAVERVLPMATLVTRSEAARIFVLRVFEAFAIATALLAAIGIYGVLAGTVTERAREIGVRAALGATRTQIVTLIGRQALGLTAVGVAIGVGASAAGSRLLDTLLFGVTRFDPWTYSTVITVVCAIAVLACAIPALRAVRIDPARALRAD
jgi:putative ABC transport system permease protein